MFFKRKPKNIFSGKNRAKKYLRANNTENNQQTVLLSLYVNGQFEALLEEHNFDLIEVFVDGNQKLGLDLQVNLRVNNNNNNIGLDFFNDHYEVCSYLDGCNPEDIENSIVRYDYKDFDIDVLLKKIKSEL